MNEVKEIAVFAPAGRFLAAFRRVMRRARPGRARALEGALRGIAGPGKNADLVRYTELWLREHPGGLMSVHDAKDVPWGGGDR